MKKKTILGLIAVMVTAFTINMAKADTESGGGGKDDGECAKASNTCIVIHPPWPLKPITKTGILTINL
ncbi:hypothetical protein ABE426_09935 [Sphingobacterium faecium]|uniref:hypothetical protein n=1 Tax=Sphingobacterium faecium TaxID=34087 RepID=UPI00320837C6